MIQERNGNGSFNKNANRNGQENPPCPDFSLYSDKYNKIVGVDLFDSKAKDIAASFKGISQTRLRRFFDEVKSISRRPDLEKNFEKEKAYIMLLKSRVSYMIGRAGTDSRDEKAGLINLKKFFDTGLKQVDSADSYLVFVTLFEAVYGFFYETSRKK